MLNSTATFNFFAPFDRDKVAFKKLAEPDMLDELLNTPLRKVHGVITDFARLSTSKDESRYRVVLQPNLALLDRQRKYAIYQDKTIHQVVEAVLREHNFHGAYFWNQSVHTYPTREFFCQWNETDLQFIQRLCSEVGVWYRFEMDPKLNREVIVFGDDSSKLVRGLTLPNVHLSNLNDNNTESVWALSAIHQVVEASVTTKDYNYRDPKNPLLNTETVRTVIDMNERNPAPSAQEITYGDAYHYQDDFLTEGTGFEPDPESGKFFAKLRHERYLNGQTRITGMSTSQSLKPGDILTVQGGVNDVPKAVTRGVIIVSVKVDNIKRDGSYVLSFEGIPYRERVGFRPDLLPKPVIAGTVPATVVHRNDDETYAWLDEHGRYHVKFNFDLNSSWKKGYSSLPVRLAKPYAGDTYGWHFPLLSHTEVQIAFINSDPDQPYIAHVMHNHNKSDHVNWNNNTRNVIRTPANNKLRMEDRRKEEHLKLNTEFGKSQLNLGHLVDSSKQKRGEGFELRTDAWGAIRAGKGIFISADEQAKAQGQVLEMKDAIDKIELANQQMQSLHDAAEQAKAIKCDIDAQLAVVSTRLKELQSAVIFASAPSAIALTSGEHLQLAADKNVMFNAGENADIGVMKNFFIGVGQAFGVFVHKLGMKLIANQGKVIVQAQNDAMELTAKLAVHITSTEDEIIITSPKKITLNAGGTYLTLDEGKIEHGTQGDITFKCADYTVTGPASESASFPAFDLSVLSPPEKIGSIKFST